MGVSSDRSYAHQHAPPQQQYAAPPQQQYAAPPQQYAQFAPQSFPPRAARAAATPPFAPPPAQPSSPFTAAASLGPPTQGVAREGSPPTPPGSLSYAQVGAQSGAPAPSSAVSPPSQTGPIQYSHVSKRTDAFGRYADGFHSSPHNGGRLDMTTEAIFASSECSRGCLGRSSLESFFERRARGLVGP